MKQSPIRYYVLLGFVFMSLILFFASRIIAAILFARLYATNGVVEQFVEKINFTVKFIGCYLAFLLSIAFIGRILSRKGNKEIFRGFLYSMWFCLVLTIVYLGTVAYLYF